MRVLNPVRGKEYYSTQRVAYYSRRHRIRQESDVARLSGIILETRGMMRPIIYAGGSGGQDVKTSQLIKKARKLDVPLSGC